MLLVAGSWLLAVSAPLLLDWITARVERGKNGAARVGAGAARSWCGTVKQGLRGDAMILAYITFWMKAMLEAACEMLLFETWLGDGTGCGGARFGIWVPGVSGE